MKNNYHDRSPGRVTNMLRDLQWLPLKEQRRAHRLNYLHKIKNREVDIDPGNIIQPGDSRTRGRGANKTVKCAGYRVPPVLIS